MHEVAQHGFYICDLRIDWKRQKYVTFWRPNNANYAWPLEWSGIYDLATIEEHGDYYYGAGDTERERFPVPVALARHLATPAVIDGKEVVCVRNTKRNRELLRAAQYVRPAPPAPKTPEEIVKAANELASEFYRTHGRIAPDGYRFDMAPAERERGMWSMACIAYEKISGTDPEDARSELEDERV